MCHAELAISRARAHAHFCGGAVLGKISPHARALSCSPIDCVSTAFRYAYAKADAVVQAVIGPLVLLAVC